MSFCGNVLPQAIVVGVDENYHFSSTRSYQNQAKIVFFLALINFWVQKEDEGIDGTGRVAKAVHLLGSRPIAVANRATWRVVIKNHF